MKWQLTTLTAAIFNSENLISLSNFGCQHSVIFIRIGLQSCQWYLFQKVKVGSLWTIFAVTCTHLLLLSGVRLWRSCHTSRQMLFGFCHYVTHSVTKENVWSKVRGSAESVKWLFVTFPMILCFCHKVTKPPRHMPLHDKLILRFFCYLDFFQQGKWSVPLLKNYFLDKSNTYSFLIGRFIVEPCIASAAAIKK